MYYFYSPRIWTWECLDFGREDQNIGWRRYLPLFGAIASETTIEILPGLPTIEVMIAPVFLTPLKNMKCSQSVAVVYTAAML
jgi:hypothetical protein